MHQNFVLNALCRIGCKPRAVFYAEGVDRFDQSDRPDGNQILGIFCRAVVLAHDMRNETQIVQNQLFPRFFVSRTAKTKGFLFFFGRQGRGEFLRRRDAENQMEHSGKQ